MQRKADRSTVRSYVRYVMIKGILEISNERMIFF
jgi:hypothetical protein